MQILVCKQTPIKNVQPVNRPSEKRNHENKSRILNDSGSSELKSCLCRAKVEANSNKFGLAKALGLNWASVLLNIFSFIDVFSFIRYIELYPRNTRILYLSKKGLHIDQCRVKI